MKDLSYWQSITEMQIVENRGMINQNIVTEFNRLYGDSKDKGTIDLKNSSTSCSNCVKRRLNMIIAHYLNNRTT